MKAKRLLTSLALVASTCAALHAQYDPSLRPIADAQWDFENAANFTENSIVRTSELPAKIHMGTLIKVAPPFSITIDKKKKHNLLICGSNERMANTVSNNYIISALLNQNATVYCIDGDSLVGDDSSADFYDAISNCNDNFKVANNRGDIIPFINEVYQNYQAWKKQNSDDVIFVVIKNLQFLMQKQKSRRQSFVQKLRKKQ
mgnify:CR=1 FL=1